MIKSCSRSWAVTQGVMVPLLLGLAFGGVADAIMMEAQVSGTIYGSSDPANVLGYGGSNLADGHRITLTIEWSTTTAPPDYYGGARFPVEADYFTNDALSWINSTVTFDSGVTWDSAAYSGNWFTTDQVKIQNDCHLCSGSFPGSTSSVWDSYGIHDDIGGVMSYPTGNVFDGYQASARIFDYTETMIQHLAIDQVFEWTPGAPGSYGADGRFAALHWDNPNPAQTFEVSGNILPDSFVVRPVSDSSAPVPEPSTLLVTASGFLTWGAMTWRRHRRG